MSNCQDLAFLDIEGGSASLTGSVSPTSQLEGDLTVKLKPVANWNVHWNVWNVHCVITNHK